MKIKHIRLASALFILLVGSVFLRDETATFALPTDRTQPDSAASALLRYQMALDEISQGHLSVARVVLEDAIHRFGNRPEFNLLLTYVLQHQGRGADAGRRAAAVAGSSSLAAAWAEQLKYAHNDPDPFDTSASPLYSRPPSAVAPVIPLAVPPLVRASQPDTRLWNLEQLMAQLVNTTRHERGLSLLVYDPGMAEVARAHSIEMRDRKYFSHFSPTAALHEPLTRYRLAFATTPRVVAENIYNAWGTRHTLTEKDIRIAHDSLMHSPGHRDNILYPAVERIGVGIVANANGDIWVTEMFAAS